MEAKREEKNQDGTKRRLGKGLPKTSLVLNVSKRPRGRGQSSPTEKQLHRASTPKLWEMQQLEVVILRILQSPVNSCQLGAQGGPGGVEGHKRSLNTQNLYVTHLFFSGPQR